MYQQGKSEFKQFYYVQQGKFTLVVCGVSGKNMNP